MSLRLVPVSLVTQRLLVWGCARCRLCLRVEPKGALDDTDNRWCECEVPVIQPPTIVWWAR